MVKFILRWLINSLSLFVALQAVSAWLPGEIDPQTFGWQTYVWGGLILGLVNALLRPVLTLLTCPLILITLGLFTFVINTFLFWLVGVLGKGFNIGYDVTFWGALVGAVIISIISFFLNMIFKDELKGRRQPKPSRPS